MSKATWNDCECVKSLIDSLWSTVALISPCPSSRPTTAQNQPLARALLWGLKYCREASSEWAICCKMRGFFLIMSCSATKWSVASLEILGWIAPFLQSSRIVLSHSTPADKWWNSHASPHSQIDWSAELISSWILGSQTVMWLGDVILSTWIKVHTLQLTKGGDISRTGVCTVLVTTGFFYR